MLGDMVVYDSDWEVHDKKTIKKNKGEKKEKRRMAKESAKARPAAKANGGPTFSELLPPRSCSHATKQRTHNRECTKQGTPKSARAAHLGQGNARTRSPPAWCYQLVAADCEAHYIRQNGRARRCIVAGELVTKSSESNTSM